MAAAFDLTRNPFCLLNLSIRAGREEIAEAYEEALSDGQADEEELIRAQQFVSTPRTRIEAELSWFPGIPPSQAREILSKLEQSSLDAHGTLERLQGLDKANLAADLCVRSGGEIEFVNALLEAYEDITDAVAHATLGSLRRVSGFPIPDTQQVGSELNALRGRHAKAAVEYVTATESPGETLTDVVEIFLDWGNDNVERLLALIVREYDAWSQPHLAKIKESIEADIAAYRGGDIVPVEQFVKLLADWDTISQPVQLLEESKGHEEPRSKEAYSIMRDFCLWLANENGQYEEALTISRALLDTFPELPAVAAQLSQDVDALEFLAEEARSVDLMRPLIGTVEEAKTEASSFDEDLVVSGFGPDSRGLAKRLYDAFTDVAARTAGTEFADMPWMVVRGLAIDLNNKHASPEGACAILEGLTSHKGTTPSTAVVERLTADQRTLRRNLKWEELKRVSGDVPKGVSLIAELLDGADAEERAALLRVKATLERKRATTVGKRMFWGLVAVAVVGFLIYRATTELSHSPRTSQTTTYTPSTSQPSNSSNSSASSQLDEQIPSPGINRTLSRNEVRYCVFQGERLEILRDLVSNNREIDYFNVLIDDFNSRCSGNYYNESIMQAVEAEVPGRLQSLRLDAQRLLSSWSVSTSSLSGENLVDITTTSGAMLVQLRLAELGYYAGMVDGIWGPASRAALKSFKLSQSGLGYDDSWNLATQRALMDR